MGNLYFISGIIFAFLIITAYGSFNIQINFHIKAINKIKNQDGKIVLSFDDGPSPEVTPRVLDLLKKYNCQAVFFVIGNKIRGNENILARMNAEGHLIGNHTYSHSYWFDLFPVRKMQEELILTNNEILRVTGIKNTLFRPPYGVTNPMLSKAVKNEKLVTIGWTKRSFDTMMKNKNKVMKRITKNLKMGDIILLHDHLENTPELLENFLKYICTTNFKIERLDKI